MRALAPLLGPRLVGLLGVTLRLEVVGAERLAPLWRAARPLIYALWHGRLLMVPWANARLRRTHGARAVTVLASPSRDGELVSALARRFGLATVRGSSSRHGALGLRRLVAELRDGRDVAVAPDGPRGPRGCVQPGVVALAAWTGAPVVPCAFGARPARRLRTWDAFLVPLPFARAALVFGEPLAIGPGADAATAAPGLARALDEVTALADRRVAGAAR